MDLQILYNNPRNSKEKNMRQTVKRKKNPSELTFRKNLALFKKKKAKKFTKKTKDGVEFLDTDAMARSFVKLPLYKSTKRKFFKPDEIRKIMVKLDGYVKKANDALEKGLPYADKRKKFAQDEIEKFEKIIISEKKKIDELEKSFRDKTYTRAYKTDKNGKVIRDKFGMPIEIPAKKAKELTKKAFEQEKKLLQKEMKEFDTFMKNLKSTIGKPKRKKVTKKVAKKTVKKPTKKVAKKTTKKVAKKTVRRPAKKVTRRTRRNPIIAKPNPKRAYQGKFDIEVESPTSTRKKAAKKTTRKVAKKAAKNTTRKSSKLMKKIAVPKTMKRKGAVSKKRSTKRRVRKNPITLQQFKERLMKPFGKQSLTNHEMSEAAGLFGGGVAVKAFDNKLKPMLSGIYSTATSWAGSYAPVVESLLDFLVVGAVAQGASFIPKVGEELKKGLVGAAVLNLAFKSTDSILPSAPMQGFVAAPMNGYVEAPMNGYVEAPMGQLSADFGRMGASADFGRMEASADFGKFVEGSKPEPIVTDADFQGMGSYDEVEYSDEEEYSDF